MQTRLKTALLGTGFVGRVHLETLRRVGQVDVTALGTADPDQAHKLAAEFGIGRVETDYRRILEDCEIDAVHICTPNSFHTAIARDALLAGKHRSEEHTSELQSLRHLVCRLLLEKK